MCAEKKVLKYYVIKLTTLKIYINKRNLKNLMFLWSALTE